MADPLEHQLHHVHLTDGQGGHPGDLFLDFVLVLGDSQLSRLVAILEATLLLESLGHGSRIEVYHQVLAEVLAPVVGAGADRGLRTGLDNERVSQEVRTESVFRFTHFLICLRIKEISAAAESVGFGELLIELLHALLVSLMLGSEVVVEVLHFIEVDGLCGIIRAVSNKIIED